MQLAYDRYGEGEPLVVLHGLLGSSDNWGSFGRRFGEDFAVYAVDLRNHGESPHREEMSYETMAEDLLHFVRSREIGPTHLVGHSLGGKVAMQFALSYPTEVDRLVVVDIAPRSYPPAHEALIDALWELDLDRVGSRREADELLAEKVPQRGVRQFLLMNLERVEEGRYAWKPNISAIRDQYPRLLRALRAGGAYRGSTLFVRGADSDFVRDRDREEIAERFPRAELVTVEGAGHWVHADRPERFGDAVAAFLED